MADSQTPLRLTDGTGAYLSVRGGYGSNDRVRVTATDTSDESAVLLDLTPEQAYTLGGALSSLAWQQGVGKR